MSNRYTADGKRKSSMTHANHTYHCSCGKVVAGNGGMSSHGRACDGYWLTASQTMAKQRAAWDPATEPCRCPLIKAGTIEPHTVADHKANVCQGYNGGQRCGTCWNCTAETR